ncbi:hypothetical protein MSG28_002319 [Choristoneura fumiferana]|uniref:Uncharacterized protein n=1 Tax=Choristoneura fumiferana TaxID=7141 RepID=A0ACC0JVA8_CHOFU|nr:hypothetical protein MSG28_002319 [Choristoneura fumiferana]
MGRITVFLILTVLFISVRVRATKIGGSYGHVKYRDVNVPQYAKHPKLNLRKQHETAINDDAVSGPLKDDAEPTFENPPEEEAQAEEDHLNDENNVDVENSQNDDDQEQSNEEIQVNPAKEDPPVEGNTDIAESPGKLDIPPDDEDENVAVRGIKAGDTFTPHELLPVTQKLMEKVEHPGEGKGIVSSSKSPEALADVIFESFFFGPHRIVTLEDKDIIGLDALQALAISGDEARRMPTQVTAPAYLLNIEDQIVKISPRTSKYLLLRKSNSTETPQGNVKKIYKFRSRKDKRMIKRRAPNTSRQKLVSKLQKKRKLVLNPVRKNNKINKTKHINRSGISKIKKASKSMVNPGHKNIKHNKTKAVTTSASTKVHKGVKAKVNSARKYDKMNLAKITKTVALSNGAKPVKGMQSPKTTQKNQRFSKNGTVASNVVDKPDKANKQKNNNKKRNKSIMLNRIKGNPATPRPSSAITVHRTSTLCRWRYECTDPGDLDTCRLRTQCNLGSLKATTNSDLEARIMQFKPPVLLATTEAQSNNYDECTSVLDILAAASAHPVATIALYVESNTDQNESKHDISAIVLSRVYLLVFWISWLQHQAENSIILHSYIAYMESTMANLDDQSKNSAQDVDNPGDEKREMEGVADSDFRRKENKQRVWDASRCCGSRQTPHPAILGKRKLAQSYGNEHGRSQERMEEQGATRAVLQGPNRPDVDLLASATRGPLWGNRGFVCAIADEVIMTNNYRRYILKDGTVDICRACRRPGESLRHIISGCSHLANGEYLHRHNLVARIIHQQLALRYGLVDSEVPYYRYVPAPFLENGRATLYWDRSVITDRTIVANKPDIVLTDRSNRQAVLVDITIPHDENLVKAEKDKLSKYLDLAHE